jgi:alpha-N-arabinofuranosidase
MSYPLVPRIGSFLILGLSFLLCSFGQNASAQTNFSIYSDQVDNAFQNWSWGTNNFSSTSPLPVHSGTHAISFTSVTWDAISFEHTAFNPAPYTNLTFWANGGTSGGQILQIYLESPSASGPAFQLPALTNGWQFFNLSFRTLGVAGITNLYRINLQLTASGATGPFYLDDVNLAASSPIIPPTAHLSVDASHVLRAADARWFGLNTAVWDNLFDSSATSNALQQLGTRILRFPGGSLSDDYHWASDTTDGNTWTWATSFANFIHIATNAGVQTMITVNYGSGSSNEAAAWVLAANVTNHLNFKNWEIGNECYGTWETDSNNSPHDPYTYAKRAAGYIALMKQADPTIKIGVMVTPGENTYSSIYTATNPATNPRTGVQNIGWTPILLTTLKSLGVKPDFLIHHVYPENGGNDDDASLLQSTGNWASDAADLRQQITDYYGPTGMNIEIICTENNSESGNQGKQSTSLVNGLYLADSLAQLMKTEINGYIWWDLRNGPDTTGDFSSALYGWRSNGDIGMIGGASTYYPPFYAFKLMQYFAAPGDTVLNATSDYNLLSAYASRKADGALDLLVINKDRFNTLTGQVAMVNFTVSTGATIRSFGIAQDEAARTNGPAVNQDIALTNFPSASANFTATFPPYSLTLYTFAPSSPTVQAGLVAGGKYQFQVLGQSNVTYQIQTSTNLLSWSSNATVKLSGVSGSVTNDMSAGARFWRAVWVP